MHELRTESDLDALDDDELRGLIDQRIAELLEYVDDFGELVSFLVVQPRDDIAAVDAALGFQVLANRFDGMRFGTPGFTPSWDVLAEHAGWFELVYVLRDDGYGVTVFVSKAEGTPAELLVMCSRYATAGVDP